MSKKVYLMRSAPYEYMVPGMNLYQSFDVIGKGEYEVEIDEPQLAHFAQKIPPQLKNGVVLSSPRLRSVQTALLLTPRPVVAEELREVGYSMIEFISESEFFNADGSPNVTKARKAFVHALIEDRLSEKFAELIERIEKILARVVQMPNKKVVMISHGFFMKIFEAYMLDAEIKKEPRRLLKYFSGEKEAFHFGDVVEFEQKGNNLTVRHVEK